MSERPIDKLTFMDYLGAMNFLRAYADTLKEDNVLRSSEERESAELVWQVTDGLATQMEKIFKKSEEESKFNKIINNETWEGFGG